MNTERPISKFNNRRHCGQVRSTPTVIVSHAKKCNNVNMPFMRSWLPHHDRMMSTEKITDAPIATKYAAMARYSIEGRGRYCGSAHARITYAGKVSPMRIWKKMSLEKTNGKITTGMNIAGMSNP